MFGKYIASVSAAAMLMGAAQAEIVFIETFDYADGDLVANSDGVWTGFGGYDNPSRDRIDVIDGRAYVVMNSESDAFARFEPAAFALDYYYGFDLTMLTNGSSGNPFINLQREDSTLGSQSGLSQIYVGNDGQDGTNSLNLSTSGSNADVFGSESYAIGETVRVVVRKGIFTDADAFWVDPTSQFDTPDAETRFGDSRVPFGVGLIQGFSNEDVEMYIDNIVVATTFQEALIPAPGAAALLGLSGIAAMRRRRA